MHSDRVTQTHVQGIPLSPGVAVGRVCLYAHGAHDSAAAPARSLGYERRRLNVALERMIQRLEVLAGEAEAKMGPDEADIFRAHRMILEDESFRQQLFELVEGTNLSAEEAVQSHFNHYTQQLRAADSEYLRQRIDDLTEIQRWLLDHLRQATPFLHCRDMTHCTVGQCPLGHDHILVAEELFPSLPIEVEKHTVGFLVEKGGPNSHAAILARGLQLPAISGVRNLLATIPPDAQLLINGNTGEIIINPSEQIRCHFESTVDSRNRRLQIHDPIPELKVMASIARSADVQAAAVAKADGIGLYRTEMEVLAEGRLLSEAEQTALYKEVNQAMAGKPVFIRLFDLGADKAAASLGMPREDNPALGCRGARLLLARPELLRTQARARARASADHPIHVVYPMIVDLQQFRKIRSEFDAAVADLQPSDLSHGVLFEVPSACLQARQILREADFGCIGTNDLIQDLFAEDRSNEVVADAARSVHPVLWGLIEDLAQAGKATGKPMSICGECASNPDLVRRVMNAGISTISTGSKCIAAVRLAARANA